MLDKCLFIPQRGVGWSVGNKACKNRWLEELSGKLLRLPQPTSECIDLGSKTSERERLLFSAVSRGSYGNFFKIDGNPLRFL